MLLDRLELGSTTLPHSVGAVLDAVATDKKQHGGRLRWVLATAGGWTVRADIPAEVVEAAARSVLSGTPAWAVGSVEPPSVAAPQNGASA